MNAPSQISTARLISVLFFFCLVGSAVGDVIPEGYKGIRNELLIEGMERFPEVTFAIHPIRYGQDTGMEVKSGKNVRFYHLVRPDLYALKAGTDVKDGSVYKDESIPRSNIAIRQVGSVPRSETASLIRRVYRITDISGNHIALEKQPDEYYDSKGELMKERMLLEQKNDPPNVEDLVSEPEDKKMLFLAGGAGLFVLLAFIFTWVRRKNESSATAE